jgi:hypothetical protein
VDKRINERAAIDTMIRHRLHGHIMSVQQVTEETEEEKESVMPDSKSRLKQFLDKREDKRQQKVTIDKSEVKCPDCKSSLYKSEGKNEIELCICYGDQMKKNIKFTKTEDGKIKFKFPKSFEIENIEMLLDAMKKQ